MTISFDDPPGEWSAFAEVAPGIFDMPDDDQTSELARVLLRAVRALRVPAPAPEPTDDDARVLARARALSAAGSTPTESLLRACVPGVSDRRVRFAVRRLLAAGKLRRGTRGHLEPVA